MQSSDLSECTISREEADAFDRMPLHPLVYVGPSRVCEGFGVFAATDLPANALVTAYAGAHGLPRHHAGTSGRYAFICDDDTVIDAECPAQNWYLSRGRAQTCNDVIHETLTGYDNNCAFAIAHVSRAAYGAGVPGTSPSFSRAYLCTTEQVRQDAELTVPYCLGYWLYAAQDTPDDFSEGTRYFLACHARVRDMLRLVFPHLRMYDFENYVSDTDELAMRVDEDERAEIPDDVPMRVRVRMAYSVSKQAPCPCECDEEATAAKPDAKWVVELLAHRDEEDGKCDHDHDVDEDDSSCSLRVSCARCMTWIVPPARPFTHAFGKRWDVRIS